MKTVGDIGEMGLIRRLTRGLKLDESVALGPGDDTAVIEWKAGKYLLYTCDMLVEDVHFRTSSATAFQIGWKALGRNISDIAAMGGIPRYATVSIAMPPRTRVSLADGIYRGIRRLAGIFDVNIVGGDISRSDRIVIDISLIGEVEKKSLVTRRGARNGDMIFVTGRIGGSHRRRHLEFMPRVKEARSLVGSFKLHSMIDISDGLLLDLGRVLASSGVGARIYKRAIPISGDAGSFDKAVRQGEDFELLFTMGAGDARRLIVNGLKGIKTPVAVIGDITDKREGYTLIDEEGKVEKVRPEGYLHFK